MNRGVFLLAIFGLGLGVVLQTLTLNGLTNSADIIGESLWWSRTALMIGIAVLSNERDAVLPVKCRDAN